MPVSVLGTLSPKNHHPDPGELTARLSGAPKWAPKLKQNGKVSLVASEQRLEAQRSPKAMAALTQCSSRHSASAWVVGVERRRCFMVWPRLQQRHGRGRAWRLAFISGLYGLRECSTKARLAMGRSLACPRPISCFPCNCGSPGEPCLCKSRVGIRWYQVKEEGEGGKFDIDSWHRAADCPTSVCFSDSP